MFRPYALTVIMYKSTDTEGKLLQQMLSVFIFFLRS